MITLSPSARADNLIGRIRERDPLWYRAVETCIAVAIVVSNLFSDALEDGTARIAARFRRFQ